MEIKLNKNYNDKTLLKDYYPIVRDNFETVEECINEHSRRADKIEEQAAAHKKAEVIDHPDGSVTTEKIAEGAIVKTKLSEAVRKTLDNADSHVANKNNPHGVTKQQVGLGDVDNVKQASKAEFDALAETTDGLTGRINDVEEDCKNMDTALDEIIIIQKELIAGIGDGDGTSGGGSGGDMYSFVYDTDKDGIVDMAQCDAEGNDIAKTYATKSNLDALQTEAENKYMTAEVYDADGDGVTDKAKCDADGNNIAETYAKKKHNHSADDVISGVLPISRGGTGGSTAEAARERLGAAAKDDIGWVSLGEASYADSYSASENRIKTTIFTLPPENEVLKEYSFFRIIMKAGSTITGKANLYNAYIATSGGSSVYKYLWLQDENGKVLDCDRVVGIQVLDIRGDNIINPPNEIRMDSTGNVTYAVAFEIQGRK